MPESLRYYWVPYGFNGFKHGLKPEKHYLVPKAPMVMRELLSIAAQHPYFSNHQTRLEGVIAQGKVMLSKFLTEGIIVTAGGQMSDQRITQSTCPPELQATLCRDEIVFTKSSHLGEAKITFGGKPPVGGHQVYICSGDIIEQIGYERTNRSIFFTVSNRSNPRKSNPILTDVVNNPLTKYIRALLLDDYLIAPRSLAQAIAIDLADQYGCGQVQTSPKALIV